MKKHLVLLLLMITTLSLVSASEIFKLDDEVNYRFRCYDTTGDYCSSSVVLLLNVEYPNGTNAVDNLSMTYNPTYFNATLPTNTLGVGYKALIHSPSYNNTITEFSYDVTQTGKEVGILNLGLNIFMICLILFLLVMAVRKYGGQDFESLQNKIINRHEGGNYFKTFGRTFVFGLMKHSFLWFYTAGWLLLFFVNETMLFFGTTELYGYFVLVMNIYSIGFLIVIVVFIGMVIRHFEYIKELLDDINLGVNG